MTAAAPPGGEAVNQRDGTVQVNCCRFLEVRCGFCIGQRCGGGGGEGVKAPTCALPSDDNLLSLWPHSSFCGTFQA